MTERETRIREWAYRLWEQEGYPHGRDGEHWFRAVEIVLQEEGQPAPATVDASTEAAPEAAPPAAGATTAPESGVSVAAAKPKATKARKAAAEPKIAEAPASVTPSGRKRS
ncbi:DUF2934 domain-containing protein [Ancylobacter sp.]|uniref:DUF2934 domain-containing protein n=1 Tax=Ancylobacter sp. TaxID=1872567 RepID=UPI003D11B883